MADRPLPTVPSPVPGPRAPAGSVEAVRRSGSDREERSGGPGGRAAFGGGRGPGDPRPSGPTPRAMAMGAALLAGGLIAVLGVASLVGEGVRSAVLVEVDRSPVGSQPSYSDAPAEAAAFFARRDTVRVRVPRDMTVGEFLALYHLETNTAARTALRDQLGAVADGDVLREGDRVTLTLTVPRMDR